MDRERAGDMLERIVRAIDPAMPVPVPVQLRGVLEYGIATGEIDGGARLPSVRRLAARLGPVAGHGQRRLRRPAGARPCRGADRARAPSSRGAGRPRGRDAVRQVELRARIDAVAVTGARAWGCRRRTCPGALANAMTARHAVRIAVLGTFPDATAAYADALRPLVRAGDVVTAVGVDDAGAGAVSFDLILAPRTILSRGRAAVPGHARRRHDADPQRGDPGGAGRGRRPKRGSPRCPTSMTS